MTTELSKYDIAKKALAEARSFDEVKTIIDKSAQAAEYARRAKDTSMIDDATEINLWAKRKAGGYIAEMKKHPGGRPSKTSPLDGGVLKLNEIGASHNQAADWQMMWFAPEEKFKAAILESKATGLNEKAVMRRIKPPRAPRPLKPTPAPVVDPMDDEEPPTIEDQAALYAEIHERNTYLEGLVESNEPLKVLDQKVKLLTAEVERYKRINFGLTNDRNDAIRLSKFWQTKFEKLEKEHKRCRTS